MPGTVSAPVIEPAPTEPPRRGLQAWQKMVLLAVLVAAGLAGSSYFFGKDVRDPKKLVMRLESVVGDLGILAPLAFIAIQSIGPFLFLPAIPMAIAAGALFGPVWGAIWSLVGNVIGAILSFLAGRALGQDFVARRATGKLLTVKALIEKEGWRFVAFIRLVPMFPFGLINMTLGTTNITFRAYTITTLVCMAPGSVVYAYLGHAGRKAAAGADDTARSVGIAVGLLVLLSGIPAAVRWIRYRKEKKDASAAPSQKNDP